MLFTELKKGEWVVPPANWNDGGQYTRSRLK